MRVILPFTHLTSEVTGALDATGFDYEPVDVSGSDRAYYDLLAELWEAGETFAIIEHDIVVFDGALDELAECDNDWCAFPFRYANQYGWGLGCVKFGERLIARNPEAMIRAGVMFDDNHPKRHWCRLDAWLQGAVLPSNGEERCPHHLRVVEHLGWEMSSHGCEIC